MKTLIMFTFLLLTSCATILHGTHQEIPVNSVPEGASVSLDNNYLGLTPLTIDVKRSKNFILVLALEGYQIYEQNYEKELDPIIIGNFLLGGIPGLFIDFIGGAAYKFNPDDVNIILKPNQ